MTKATTVLKVFLILAVVNIGLTTAGDRQDCLKKSRGMLKGFMKLFNKCSKELGSLKKTPQEYQDQIGCIVKCTMKKTNILDDKDYVTEEMMKKSIESTFPEEYKKIAHEKMVKCVALHDSLDPKDPKCTSYLKLGSCMQEGLTDLCGEMPLI